jgi:hypothetical protein
MVGAASVRRLRHGGSPPNAERPASGTSTLRVNGWGGHRCDPLQPDVDYTRVIPASSMEHSFPLALLPARFRRGQHGVRDALPVAVRFE